MVGVSLWRRRHSPDTSPEGGVVPTGVAEGSSERRFVGPEVSLNLLAARKSGSRPRTQWFPANPVALYEQLKPVYTVGSWAPKYALLRAVDSTLEELAGIGTVAAVGVGAGARVRPG